MRTFIRLVLSEEGLPSSKRVGFFIFLFSFLTVVFVNLFTGKQLAAVVLEDLFYGLQVSMLTVFGANILNKLTDVKKVQSANNALVGAPSPQPVSETQAAMAPGAPAEASAVITQPK